MFDKKSPAGSIELLAGWFDKPVWSCNGMRGFDELCREGMRGCGACSIGICDDVPLCCTVPLQFDCCVGGFPLPMTGTEIVFPSSFAFNHKRNFTFYTSRNVHFRGLKIKIKYNE